MVGKERKKSNKILVWFITKDSLVISKRASRFTVALQELACGAASNCEKSLVVF